MTQAAQDEDCFLIAYEDGTLAAYDWTKDKMLDQRAGLRCRAMSASGPAVQREQRILAVGGEKGDLKILRPQG